MEVSRSIHLLKFDQPPSLLLRQPRNIGLTMITVMVGTMAIIMAMVETVARAIVIITTTVVHREMVMAMELDTSITAIQPH